MRHGSPVIHALVQERLKHISFSVSFITKFRFGLFPQFCFHKYQLVCAPECVSKTLLCFHHPFTRAPHVSHHSSKFAAVNPNSSHLHELCTALSRCCNVFTNVTSDCRLFWVSPIVIPVVDQKPNQSFEVRFLSYH